MATPTGIIGFKGTIGGISFYMRKGKPFARKAGGPSKEKIAKSKSFQRTRENNEEFKGAVAASKWLRTGLSAFTKRFSDGNLSWRMNGVFKKMIDRSEGVRGARSVDILPNKDMLMGFQLSKEVSFDQIFHAPFSVHANAARNEVQILVPNFDSAKCMHSPAGATHFRLIHDLTVVPKLNYNAVVKQYVSDDAQAIVLKADASSPYIALHDMVGSDILLAATLPGSPVIAADSALVCCIGLEFYQEVGGVMYGFSEGRAMMVCGVV